MIVKKAAAIVSYFLKRDMQKKNIAVILAAGNGDRAGFPRPKQLTKLAGRPIVVHTVQRFQNHPNIDEIAIVTNQDCIADMEGFIPKYRFTKVKNILLGGKERHESSLVAVRAYENETTFFDIKLIFHDAVRPLVDDRTISEVIASLDSYNAVNVTMPASDTVVIADPDANTIREIPDRRLIHLGQTPQGFAYGTIKKAYEAALQDAAFRTTDDCGVVLKYLPEEKIYLVRGALNNVKLTFPDDLLIIDKYMQANAGRRLEAASDAAMLSALKGISLVVFGGTGGIGSAIVRLARAFGANVHVASRSTGVDITDQEAVRLYLKKVAAGSGKIDAIINVAAVLNREPFAHMSPVDMTNSIQTNFAGALNIARFSFNYLKSAQGHLVFFTSSSYTYGRAGYSVYSASKAAIVNLTQALADEWADFDIRVNCINPERTRTPMRTKSFGIESQAELLEPDVVASKTLGVLLGQSTGYIYDITKA